MVYMEKWLETTSEEMTFFFQKVLLFRFMYLF